MVSPSGKSAETSKRLSRQPRSQHKIEVSLTHLPGSQQFFRIEVPLVSLSRFPVVVISLILKSIIESALMVLLVFIDVLNERYDLLEI